jgi:DHA1 family multidrug resistance protein-like MFS transporter
LGSRILAGLAAANVVVTQAYLAETTQESERAGVMGRIGAAISIGLIVGPFFGGQLVQIGGSQLLGIVAGSASAVGAVILAIGMKNLPPKSKREPGKTPIIDFRLLSEVPGLKSMFVLATVAWFALACLEGTFGRLVAHKFEFPLTELGMHFTLPQGASGTVFALESLVAFAVQGLLYGTLAKKFEFGTLLRLSYILQGIGLLLTPFAPGFGVILAFSALYSLGGAISNPTVNTACSNMVSEEKQGELFGLLQASRSIGFLFGPLIGGALFDLRPSLPYVVAGAVAIAAALLVPPFRKLAAEPT